MITKKEKGVFREFTVYVLSIFATSFFTIWSMRIDLHETRYLFFLSLAVSTMIVFLVKIFSQRNTFKQKMWIALFSYFSIAIIAIYNYGAEATAKSTSLEPIIAGISEIYAFLFITPFFGFISAVLITLVLIGLRKLVD